MSSSRTDTDGVVLVTMPEAGSSASLVCWLKQTGDEVEADEPICLVRVGDMEAEVVSPDAGTVGALQVDPGQPLEPGDSLAEILPARPNPLPSPRPVRLKDFRSPAVRRLAAEHRLDLERVRGTGRDGRVSREDVLGQVTP